MWLTLFATHHMSAIPQKSGNAGPSKVVVSLYNNRPWPYHARLISYSPQEAGNATQTFWLLPFGSKQLRFVSGTRLYLANQPQIDTVMSGNALAAKPWYILSIKDDGNIINLH